MTQAADFAERSSDPAHPNAPHARWGLALLIALALYTSMDRQVLGLLAAPLRRDLGVDDTQFGLLQGAGVALFTALAGYPLAWIADRADRRWVLVLCMSAWCAALAGCGFANSFSELFVVSSLMGAAEAGVIPIAYVLIADWFSPRQRQAATSLFVLLGRLAVGLTIAASGALVASVDLLRPLLPPALQQLAEWRLALGLTALPGLLIVPLLLTLPKTTPSARGLLAATLRSPGTANAGADAGRAGLGVLTLLLLGAALLAGGAAAVGVFMPVLVQRLGGLTAAQAGAGLGAAALLAALAALAISTWLARRQPLETAGSRGVRVAALGMAIAALSAVLLALANTHPQALVLYAGALGGTMTAVMLLVGVLQSQAPAAARTRFMAVFVGAAAIAAALTPVAVGALSDAGGASPTALAQAMAALGAPCFAGAALVMALAARGLSRRVIGPSARGC